MYEHLTDEQLERLIAQKWKEVSDERNQAQKKNPQSPHTYEWDTANARLLRFGDWKKAAATNSSKEKNQQLKTLLIIVGVISLILYFVLG